MQLLQAIEAWSAQHGSRLSDSTKSDIAEIIESIDRCGFSDWAASDIDAARRATIAEQTAESVSLNREAIAEFVGVVTSWAAKQPVPAPEPERPSASTFQDSFDAGDDDDDDEDELTDEVDDDDDEDELTDEVDDDDDDDELTDEVDDDEYDDDDDDDDEDEDYEYDDDEYDDDEYDDDDSGEVEVVVGGGASGLEPDTDDRAAASSFFATIGKSPLAAVEDASEADDAGLGLADAPTTMIAAEPKGGIFSAAAEEVPTRRGRRIDWITLAYFTVAAICFALALYFYFSKN